MVSLCSCVGTSLNAVHDLLVCLSLCVGTASDQIERNSGGGMWCNCVAALSFFKATLQCCHCGAAGTIPATCSRIAGGKQADNSNSYACSEAEGGEFFTCSVIPLLWAD